MKSNSIRGKILFFCSFLVIISFHSCIILNAEQNLCVDSIEYIDNTHFRIYCTGYGSDGGLPANEYIRISDKYDNNASVTHKVIDRVYSYTLFISVGVIADCEVSPPFMSGEKVFIWLDSPFENTYGYAELNIP